MNIDHIRTFLEVAACGNFHQAAQTLNVTQSTVSARVKALEDRFGRSLFQRSHSGAELTAAGRHLHQFAAGMQLLWQQAHQAVTLPPGYRAVLGLGAQVSLWDRLILQWIARMRAEVPDVAVRAEADYSISLMRQLSDGLLDIGVMYQPRQIPGFKIETLLEETLVLVSTSKRTLSHGWVEDYVFVDWGDEFRVMHGDAFPDMETPAVSVGLGALGLQYILQKGGSGYFPIRVARPLIDRGELHPVADAPVGRRPAYVVYARDPRDPELLSHSLDILRDVASLEDD